MANDEDTTLAEVKAALAREKAGWEAGDNPIGRLPLAKKLRRLGANKPPHSPPGPQAPVTTAKQLPAAFDLRNVGGKNYITDIRDQLDCGSCVAFGTLASIEGAISWAKKTANPKIDLSEAHLYFCDGGPTGVTCDTGWWPALALPFCVSPGIVDEKCFPYSDHDQPCTLCEDWKNRLTTIKSFHRLSAIAAMKQWIYDNGPIISCFEVYGDFFWYKSGVYRHVTGNLSGGHCVATIGYDDNDQCWICKNSWGPGWGDGGYFRIAYGECGIDTWDIHGVIA